MLSLSERWSGGNEDKAGDNNKFVVGPQSRLAQSAGILGGHLRCMIISLDNQRPIDNDRATLGGSAAIRRALVRRRLFIDHHHQIYTRGRASGSGGPC